MQLGAASEEVGAANEEEVGSANEEEAGSASEASAARSSGGLVAMVLHVRPTCVRGGASG